MKNIQIGFLRGIRQGLQALLFLAAPISAQAGVFNIPKFVEPGHVAVGLEPELTLTNDAGLAVNLRYQHGVTDLSNLHLVLGTGSDPRKFRMGGAYTFDFFPDVEDQPGIGIALSGVYYRYWNFGQLDATLTPYIHKAFYNGPKSVEPYLAIPTGPEFRSKDWNWASTLVVGGMFHTEGRRFSFIAEIGVSLNQAETYISGGILFVP